MIKFIVTKDNQTIEIECSLEDTILILKQKIIKEFKLSCDYIDIDFILDRPIRSLGKFNLESGILPRTLDHYEFNRYGLDKKEINTTFHEVLNYKKYEKKIRHKSLYTTRNDTTKDNDKKNEFTLDINSDIDFPTL